MTVSRSSASRCANTRAIHPRSVSRSDIRSPSRWSGYASLPNRARAWAALAAFAMVAGCEVTSPENASKMAGGQLCYSLAVSRAGNSNAESGRLALDELRRRGAFTERELAGIARGQPYIGMSENAAICAWGGGVVGENTTVTAAGTSKQIIFGGQVVPYYYLYTTNGRVTAFQR